MGTKPWSGPAPVDDRGDDCRNDFADPAHGEWSDDIDLPETATVPDENFAEAVFGGSRLVFWCIAPLLLCCAASLLLTVRDWQSWEAATRVGLAVVCLLLSLALWNPRRFCWAARGVTGMVFLACCGYLLDAVWAHPGGGGRGSSLGDAIAAFVVIGLPSLVFTLRGRRQHRIAPAAPPRS